MNKTNIDWCDSTWNPVTGCLHGCTYCYARGIANRFKGKEGYEINEDNVNFVFRFDGLPTIYELNEPCFFNKLEEDYETTKTDIRAPYPYGFQPTLHRYRMNEYADKNGRNIFVCSMADLFGDWVPDSWIDEVFKACKKAPQHNYLFLTKNPERYLKLQEQDKLITGDNMWYGVSATDSRSIKKASDILGNLGCDVKTFLSIEPLLDDITQAKEWETCVTDVYADWIIVGAETGNRKDKVVPEKAWIESIVSDCNESWGEIPIFMKSSLSDIWEDTLIQEFPKQLRKGE